MNVASNFSRILMLLEKLVKIEEAISTEIAKEKDAKRRKKMQKAIDDRNCQSISDMWFDPD